MAVVAAGFTTDIYVEVAAVATASVLTDKDFSINLTLNHLFIGCFGLLLLISCPYWGLGPSVVKWFCHSWLVLVYMVGYHFCLLVRGRSASPLSEMGKDRVWDSMVCMI